ncbi:MAG: L,D-transpeptidase [Opitutaceae bacterium]|nr:L,D-transpeptidase [Verrucomicrobiales bacterium]
MNAADEAVAVALRTCRQQGVIPGRHLLTIHIATQTLAHFEQANPSGNSNPLFHQEDGRGLEPFCRIDRTINRRAHSYCWVNRYRCSTSKFGIGSVANSNCTPLGLHRIAKKIGGGWPVASVFKGRQHVGYTWDGLPIAPITDRIFWLEGLEPGRNRGGQVDTFARYIYVHGTGDEPTLGRPASHGCIHLSSNDLLPLHDLLPAGTLVWIAEH